MSVASRTSQILMVRSKEPERTHFRSELCTDQFRIYAFGGKRNIIEGGDELELSTRSIAKIDGTVPLC